MKVLVKVKSYKEHGNFVRLVKWIRDYLCVSLSEAGEVVRDRLTKSGLTNDLRFSSQQLLEIAVYAESIGCDVIFEVD
jgi:hypothetical protein